MENRPIFLAYLVVWCVYLVGLYIFASYRQLRWRIVSASHAIPSAVAVIMVYVFLIKRGGTIAQLVAASESGMSAWKLWFHLWPTLLILTATCALIHAVWVVVACVRQRQKKWLSTGAATLLMSVFAFFTVAANFPDA